MKALALVLLVGCSHASGPAWPTPHPKWDGGESLAPRSNNPIAAAAATDVEEIPEIVPVKVEPAKPVPSAPVVRPVSPATPPVDEPLETEGVTIEIEE